MKSGKHNSCIVYAWCECETVPQSQSLSTHTPVLDTARTHCSYCAAGQCETKQFTTLRQEKKKQENKNKKLIEQTQAFPLLRNGVSTEWMSASRNFYVLLPPLLSLLPNHWQQRHLHPFIPFCFYLRFCIWICFFCLFCVAPSIASHSQKHCVRKPCEYKYSREEKRKIYIIICGFR